MTQGVNDFEPLSAAEFEAMQGPGSSPRESKFIDPDYELCLNCPLPDCDDRDPACPRRQQLELRKAQSKTPSAGVTVPEAVELSGTSAPFVRGCIRRGDVRSWFEGRRQYVDAQDVSKLAPLRDRRIRRRQ